MLFLERDDCVLLFSSLFFKVTFVIYTTLHGSAFCLLFSLQLSVDTLQFLLFLYIQQLNRVSLRTSLIGEEWPSHRIRSPSPSDRESKTSSQIKVCVTARGQFIQYSVNVVITYWAV